MFLPITVHIIHMMNSIESLKSNFMLMNSLFVIIIVRYVQYVASRDIGTGGLRAIASPKKINFAPYLTVTSEFLLHFRPIISIKTTINWAN